MKCDTCGGYIQDLTTKKRWLGIFVLLFIINAPLTALREGIEDPIMPAVRHVFLFNLVISSTMFGIAFLLSLLAKPENQLKVCAVISGAIVSLMALGDLGLAK